MKDAFLDFGVGFFAGGLAVSTAWGIFWLVIGLIGWSRRTCGLDVVAKGLAGGVIPCSLVIGLVWWYRGSGHDVVWFMSGLTGIPALLTILSLRPMPDGKTAGAHFVEGIRSLRATLLGTGRGCGGCHPEHDHETCR